MNKHLLRQAQQLQARLSKAQQELEETTVEATSGGGAVRAVVTGKLRLRSVHIDPAAVDPQEVELLEEMVLAAVNEALEKAQEMASRKLGEITGGLRIPGLT